MRQALALLLAFLSLALAQGTVEGEVIASVTYVEAHSLAMVLGDVVTVTGKTLTWRGREGVATFFDGSSVALLQRPGDGGPTEWPLSAAVRADRPESGGVGGSGWYVPLDAVQLLGVATQERDGEVILYAPDGSRLEVVVPPAPQQLAGPDAGTAWEPVQLGAATGVRLFSHEQSLLLLDLDLLPLAYPEAMDVIDDAAHRAGDDHALLLIGAALTEGQLSTAITFGQDGRHLEVAAPYRFHVFRGDPGAIGPGQEVAAVVLLPATFSLYRPLSVSWSGVEATITFRR